MTITSEASKRVTQCIDICASGGNPPCDPVLHDAKAKPPRYNKSELRLGRTTSHVNVVADSADDAFWREKRSTAPRKNTPGIPNKIVKQRSIFVFLAFGLVLLKTQLDGAQSRTFTDAEGRTLIAEVIEADAKTIRIRRDDGVVFDLPRERLSESDQTFIDEWIRDRAFAYGGIEVTMRRVRLKSERAQTKSSVRTTEQWCYKFSVQNHSRMQLDNLAVEYRVFWTNDRASVKEKELPRLRIDGDATISSLAPRESTELSTKTITLRTTELKSGRRYAGTSKRRVSDSLAGIWIRVLQDDVVLHEFARPSKLIKEEEW